MPTSKKRRVRAIEYVNRNNVPGGIDDWEPFMGDDDSPRLIRRKDMAVLPPIDMNDLEGMNDSLVTSSRLSRIARQMIKNGFRRV